MSTQFALDLRLARRKAGFTQRDVAHLIGSKKVTVCDLERGWRMPTLSQIVTLSVIYGRSFESLFAEEMKSAETSLRLRILHMPAPGRTHASTRNRTFSIDRLARRLVATETDHGRA